MTADGLLRSRPLAAGHAATLAALGVSPARLRRLLAGRTPTGAWRALAEGVHPEDPDGRLRTALARRPPTAMARRCEEAGVAVQVLGDDDYPSALAGDDEAPAVLFGQGAPGVLETGPRVAVMGTRSASAVGREVAEDIGRAIAAAGAVVVSGLAEGIDGAVLRGALEATDGVVGPGGGAVAVLGTAHDAVAGAEPEQLRRRLAASGLVLSELPPGAPSARWRFGARNRIVAALAALLVMVECHDGEMRAVVTAARRRQVPVAAVPGSVRCAASAGTNTLLVDGAACVRDGADVVALVARRTGWVPVPPAGRGGPSGSRGGSRCDAAGAQGTGELAGAVLAAIADAPADVDALARQTGAAIGSVALCLEQLAARGRARAEGGWWRAVPPRR